MKTLKPFFQIFAAVFIFSHVTRASEAPANSADEGWTVVDGNELSQGSKKDARGPKAEVICNFSRMIENEVILFEKFAAEKFSQLERSMAAELVIGYVASAFASILKPFYGTEAEEADDDFVVVAERVETFKTQIAEFVSGAKRSARELRRNINSLTDRELSERSEKLSRFMKETQSSLAAFKSTIVAFVNYVNWRKELESDCQRIQEMPEAIKELLSEAQVFDFDACQRGETERREIDRLLAPIRAEWKKADEEALDLDILAILRQS